MSFIKRTGDGDFTPHPKGTFIFTIADFVLDKSTGQYGEREQIRWMCDSTELMDNGMPFRQSYWTTPTINEKSNFKKLIEAVGLDPADPFWDTLEEIGDLQFMVGKTFLGNVVHKPKADGKIQARIDTVMPVPQVVAQPKARATVPKSAPAAPQRELVGAGASPSPNWGDDE